MPCGSTHGSRHGGSSAAMASNRPAISSSTSSRTCAMLPSGQPAKNMRGADERSGSFWRSIRPELDIANIVATLICRSRISPATGSLERGRFIWRLSYLSSHLKRHDEANMILSSMALKKVTYFDKAGRGANRRRRPAGETQCVWRQVGQSRYLRNYPGSRWRAHRPPWRGPAEGCANRRCDRFRNSGSQPTARNVKVNRDFA